MRPWRPAQLHAQKQEWLLGFLLSVSAVLALWAGLQWLLTREPVTGAYAIKQGFSTLWVLFLLGFGRVLMGDVLGAGTVSMIASCVLPWVIASAAWFVTALLREYGPSKSIIRLIRGLAILVGLLPLLQLADMTRLSLVIANGMILAFTALLLLALVTADRSAPNPPIPRPYLMGYLALNGVLNALSPAMFLGLLPESEAILAANLTHVLTDSVVMLLMLQFRARAMESERQSTALALLRSQERAETERRQREEQGQLFAMLAHEMKTPLATLRMWMDAGPLTRGTLERAIGDMNQVIERCVHTGQLTDDGLKPLFQEVDAVALTRAAIEGCRSPDHVDAVLPDSPALLKTDTQMLSIVLGNLLDNACKYSPPDSRIEVTLAPAIENGRAGWRWQVISQAGSAGLPDADSVFEKYYRSPHARRQSGSGLGLFLVKGLLTLMQGGISYTPRADEAVFTVWLPESP